MRPLKAGESLTPGGFIRRADGVVEVPPDALALNRAWKAAGNIAGLTMAEIVQRVGFNADAVPAKPYTNGYAHTWSRPGYSIGILFGHDNRAIGVVDGSERLGMPPPPGIAFSAPRPQPLSRDAKRKMAVIGGVVALVVVGIAVAIGKHHDPALTKSEIHELRTTYNIHYSSVVSSDSLTNTNNGKTLPNERAFNVQDFAGNMYEVDVNMRLNEIDAVWHESGFLNRGDQVYPGG